MLNRGSQTPGYMLRYGIDKKTPIKGGLPALSKKVTGKDVGAVVARVFLTLLCFVVVLFVGMLSVSPDPEFILNQPPYKELIGFFVQAGFALMAVYLLQVKLDKRSFYHVGLTVPWSNAVKGLFKGMGVGLASVGLVVVAAWSLGAISYSGSLRFFEGVAADYWTVPFTALFFQASVGFVEEIFFRGYLLQFMRSRLGIAFAVVFSAAIFSLLHTWQPGITVWAAVNLFLAGVLFALLFVYYNNLWPAIGFHFAFNWTQYNLFQLQWGRSSPGGFFLFSPNPEFRALLSGSTYGYEGTVFVTVLLASLIVFYWRMLVRSRCVTVDKTAPPRRRTAGSSNAGRE